MTPADRDDAAPLDLDAFGQIELRRVPFDYVVVPGFVRPAAWRAAIAGFPRLPGAGSHPADGLAAGPGFAALVAALRGPSIAAAFSNKFGLDLMRLPRMITVRGHAQGREGGIHTDSATKVITALIYLNESWPHAGGRLRLLRSADDLDDFAEEVAPLAGTLIAFRRSERSWHGHLPFTGERRSLQLNWVTSRSVVRRELLRHRLTSAVKRLRAIGR